MIDKIRALCKEQGITIAELERRAGIGNGVVARWKTSKPSYERVALVADVLGVSPDYLLGAVDDRYSSTDPIFNKIGKLNHDNRKALASYLEFLLENQDKK
jgi:transcriptional regulator with XRE-family HTH domain